MVYISPCVLYVGHACCNYARPAVSKPLCIERVQDDALLEDGLHIQLSSKGPPLAPEMVLPIGTCTPLVELEHLRVQMRSQFNTSLRWRGGDDVCRRIDVLRLRFPPDQSPISQVLMNRNAGERRYITQLCEIGPAASARSLAANQVSLGTVPYHVHFVLPRPAWVAKSHSSAAMQPVGQDVASGYYCTAEIPGRCIESTPNESACRFRSHGCSEEFVER